MRGFSGHPDFVMTVRGLSGFPNSTAAVDAIVTALSDRDHNVRACAASALGDMKSVAAVPALVAALNDADKSVRRTSAIALGKIGNRDAVKPLMKLIGDEAVEVRLAAQEALTALGEPFDAAPLISIIKSKQTNEFQNAIWFVRRNAGKDSVRILIQCLDTTDPSVSNYYNYTLVWQIAACGGPKLKYHHDFEGKGTDEQVQENKRTIQVLNPWGQSGSR